MQSTLDMQERRSKDKLSEFSQIALTSRDGNSILLINREVYKKLKILYVEEKSNFGACCKRPRMVRKGNRQRSEDEL